MGILDWAVALSSGWVALLYTITGGAVMPNLRFPLPATLLAAAFFVGCALTHIHIAEGVIMADFTHVGESWLMLFLHVVQGVGGTGFIVAIHRGRLVVKLEDGDG